MESLLHYVWKHKLYVPANLKTIGGISFEILDPGMYNSDAGPDFFNAKIKLDGQLWVGNVEMHIRSSDWYKHKHQNDKSYNSVVLHVVSLIDTYEVKDSAGRIVPQWVLSVPEKIVKSYRYLQDSPLSLACVNRLKDIPDIYLHDWKTSLLMERLEDKTRYIFSLLKQKNNCWEEVFYHILSRNFGFNINNDAFERLARSLPLKYILKHRDSVPQVEALFLGQAGLLNKDFPHEEYYLILKNEYKFLSHKYGLSPLESYIFKNLRVRPLGFPHIKIVQLAGLIREQPRLFSSLLQITQINEMQALFKVQINPYWDTHYRFGKVSPHKVKTLGSSAVDILIINTVIPVLLAYGKEKKQNYYSELALYLLERLKPESNYIVHLFKRGGIRCDHAGDSQALIQLKKQYCDKKKCIFCRIGHKLLSK